MDNRFLYEVDALRRRSIDQPCVTEAWHGGA
jgi:hypothetical protein